MRTHRVIQRFVLVSSMLVLPWLLLSPTQAAEQAPGETIVLAASSSSLREIASGAVSDTLQACLGRIPADATEGQRMLAEQSCKQDEEIRKQVQAAPKF